MNRNHPEFKAGKRRLRMALPRLKAEIKKSKDLAEFSPGTLLGQSLSERVKEKNLESLAVYEDGEGKWYADIFLKGLPAGLPDRMGTPVKLPKASREEALEEGYNILKVLLISIKQQEQIVRDIKPKDVRYIEVEECTFSYPGELIDDLRLTLNDDQGNWYMSPKDLIAKLEDVLDGISRDKILDGDTIKNANEEQQMVLKLAAARVLASGNFRVRRDRLWV